MVDIEKLKNIKRLITHANCPDGVASALIVKDALPDVEVTFMAHGTEEHRSLEPQPGTMFCDFTPWLPNLTDPRVAIDMQDGRTATITDKGVSALQDDLISRWLDAGCIVLDHHPTQRELTMKFVEAGLGAYGENDKSECGAWLAYEHVWLPLRSNPNAIRSGDPNSANYEPIQTFAELAGVRDTWKKDDPRWQDACEQAEELMFWGMSEGSSLGSFLMKGTTEFFLGKRLFQKKLEHARKAIGESHSFQTNKGTRVLLFQGVTPTSDAAELIEKDPYLDGRGDRHTPDIVAGFHYRVDAGKLLLQFSTRSHTGYDVGAFCKSRGGGGHTAAAGFTVDQSPEVGANPYAVFRLLLEEWESAR